MTHVTVRRMRPNEIEGHPEEPAYYAVRLHDEDRSMHVQLLIDHEELKQLRNDIIRLLNQS